MHLHLTRALRSVPGLPGLDAHPGCTLPPNPKANRNAPIPPPRDSGVRVGSKVSHQLQAAHRGGQLHSADTTIATPAQKSSQPSRGEPVAPYGTQIMCICLWWRFAFNLALLSTKANDEINHSGTVLILEWRLHKEKCKSFGVLNNPSIMRVAAIPLISFTQLLLRKDIQIFPSAYSTHFIQWNTCKGRKEAEEREGNWLLPGR